MSELEGSLPLEDLLNAVSAQLDRAQAALALKAQNTALTFAVKDLSLDLRAMVEIRDAALHVRPALAGEQGASTLNISFTTVTRPMLEENAIEMKANEPAITDEIEDLSDEEARRLEWIGVRNLTQFNRARSRGGAHEIKRLSRLPTDRLKQALNLAGQRAVTAVDRAPADPSDLDPVSRFRLRVAGRNLTRAGQRPDIRVNGQAARTLAADDDAIIAEAPGHVQAGALALSWPDGEHLEIPFRFDDTRGGTP